MRTNRSSPAIHRHNHSMASANGLRATIAFVFSSIAHLLVLGL
jgi:CRISPR/Cas system CMR-associated protein Cmr5 small subunit